MNLNFEKMGGLVPAIIQDARTKNVLMLGFMNKEAFEKTQATGLVTFFSRTRNCLWTKGEESGNTLTVVSIADDCDNDTLLIKAIPAGPVCHTGAATCFCDSNDYGVEFFDYLQKFIQRRYAEMPEDLYHVAFQKGCEPHGSESGRGGCGNGHRGYKRNRRPFGL